MSKLNKKIVLFIEPAYEEFVKPSKIGNLFTNRFAIDEDAKNEILKIYQLEYQLTVTLPKSSPNTIPAGSVEPRVLILRK